MASGSGEEHGVEAKEGCTPLQASSFRKGTNIILKDKPCKVVEMSTSKTGKHGHAKVNFTGIDIFTGKKYQAIQGSTHPMLTFNSTKTEFSVMGLGDDGNTLTLLDEKGNEKDGISLTGADEKAAEAIREAVEANEKEVFVTVLEALGQYMVTGYSLKDPEDK
jgi:translation initiation factor 5A